MSAPVDHTSASLRHSISGEPGRESAKLYPLQGTWTEVAHLALPTKHLLELNVGCQEMLFVPTYFHELIVEFPDDLLRSFVQLI